jgi:hypothetical protein
MIYVTLAGYSSQRISLYRLKDNAAISDRTKIIDADDCNYWIAHPGTFKPVQTLNADATAQGYDYIPEMFDTKKFKIIRNDYQKQKAYLDMWADYLFLDKRSITLDYTLDGWTNTFEIGQPIASVKDGSVNITTNSIVESIEYFIESGTPRIRISTLLPDLPPLKKLADTVRIEGSAPVISSVATLKTPKIVTKEEEKRINITTIQGQGGGSNTADTKQEIWLRVVDGQGAGNTLTSGQYGIKKIATELASQSTWKDVYATSTLPDGLGRATIWIDGVQQVTADAPLYVAGATYTINQQVSFNDKGYKCSVPGVSTTFNTGTAQFVVDETILEKPKQVFLMLDNRAQFGYALAQYEWIRVFSLTKFGNATNPATGVAEDMRAYTGAFF